MLKKLSEEEFKRRAASADRVAVFKEFLADRETSVAALSRLDDDEGGSNPISLWHYGIAALNATMP